MKLRRSPSLFLMLVLASVLSGCKDLVEEVIAPYSYVILVNRSDSPVIDVRWRFSDAPPDGWQLAFPNGVNLAPDAERTWQIECSRTCILSVQATSGGGVTRQWAGVTIQRGYEHRLIFQ